MNTKVIITAVVLALTAAPSFAQGVADPNAVIIDPTTGLPVPATVVAPVTGFAPLAGAALGAAGPLALGLGAIIAIGAIAGGDDAGSTSCTVNCGN